MAYTLGFLYADGNIIETKRGTHFIAFHAADLSIIKLFKKILESKHTISKRKSTSGSNYRLQIGSKEMYADLYNIGLTPDKTNRMIVPNIPRGFEKDFIRGYFDGDGNVWTGFIHTKRIVPTTSISSAFTSSSENFLHSLHHLLKNLGIKGGSVFKIKNKECWRLNLSKFDTLLLYRIMYNSEGELFLKRKKLVFDRFILRS